MLRRDLVARRQPAPSTASRIGAPSSQVIVSRRLGRQLGDRLGHRDAGLVGEHEAVEPHMRGLALVVELLAQPLGDLGMDLVGR